jgi:hypothetical protein
MKTKLITYPNQEGVLDKQGHFELTCRNGRIFRFSASEQEVCLMISLMPLTILVYVSLRFYDIVTAP